MGRLTTLYFDCFSGAAGDMILGALIDVGVPLEEVRGALGSLAITPDTVWTDRVSRAGISATRFCVRGEHAPASGLPQHVSALVHDHYHEHEPHGARHPHRHGGAHVHTQGAAHQNRTLNEIASLIDRSALSAEGKARAKHLFQRLGTAEAAVHGVLLEQVHLHEVGALDSIIDVVGTVFALERLRVDRIVASPLNVGGGTVRSAHGVYPVPAPATLRLLQGAPVYASAQQVELVTPTGALLVTDYAAAYGAMPPMRVSRIGYGAGARDLPDTPNVVRVVLGEQDDSASSHSVVVIEAEIDDMNPQIFGVLMDRLLGEGALDVFYTPIQMKKSRPGTLLTIVAPPTVRERLTSTVFRETTTIGVRYQDVRRECLDRETIAVETPLGTIRFKIARRNGVVMNVAPEFDDCVRLATEHRLPAKQVQTVAMQAYLDSQHRTP
ncbi:MAG TPA: nickel pincer cofactor biosynthesis protein LarC [Vicinamibacterales bacterium]|nr:nickel pincer cofactor biosynthesis protein LarC [Vicinamibacterales bacterium]